jgi:hypothetical protein
MSLYLTQVKENPLSYALWPGYVNPDPGYVWDKYNQYLHTPPRIYNESITDISGFTYIPPPRDMFVLWTMSNIAQWPSWSARSHYFDAQTGELISQQNFVAQSYITSIEVGDLGHSYCTFAHTTDCAQKNWETLADESAIWHIHPYRGNFNPSRIFGNLIVDRQNDKILAVAFPNIDIWTGVTRGTPTLVWSMRTANTIRDMAYESNDYGWILTTNGHIYKIDWNKYKRLEMVSSVQAYNPTDKGYYLAYDQKRKRLAVYRWMPDATDGAARNRIEWYETVPKPVFVTEPVPVNRHRTGDSVRFVSNVIGDLGEGFTAISGEAELVAPNNHGAVISPNVVSGAVGEVNIAYQAPEEAATDTIKLTVEYPDTISDVIQGV